ncbi:integrator complex subunit 3 [Eucyclogobius newberryi]|uniref:integrator complex subunit 3 n=1 Tax=Eucyclogobius newberryi TaxID=166745 RepID=UPI003B5C6B36
MEPSPAKAKPQGRLLVSTPLDSKDELEERLERCVSIVQSLINGLSEREANDALTANVCKGQQQHEEVCLGLFTLILIEPAQAQRSYRDLTLVNRDGMNIVLVKINHILMEKFLKLQDQPRTQTVWLVRELVKTGVNGADGVLMTLLKQIAGGDISSKNLWLAESTLDILLDQKEWVLKSGMLIAMAVYTYLRLIVDHGAPNLLLLRQKEVDFCICMIREKFMECLVIGRDLVRLLQNVARIPEMDLLWRDLLHSPQTLCPQFTGELHYPQSSATQFTGELHDPQSSATQFTGELHDPQSSATQFTGELHDPQSSATQFTGELHDPHHSLSPHSLSLSSLTLSLLTPPLTLSLSPHSTLSLLTHSLSPHSLSLSSLTLSLLTHSLSPHSLSLSSLPPLSLFSLSQIIPHFFPPLETQVRQGVFNSLTFIMEREHLAPLFDNPKLDRELRAMLRDRFPEFCSAPSPPTEVKLEDSSLLDSNLLDKDEACYDNTEAAFSDDEEELSTKGKKREFRFHPIREAIVEEPADITPWLDQLEDSMKDRVQQLQKTSDTETQCEVMQEIVDQVLEDDFDQEQMSALACCLSELFKEHFRGDVLPDEITEESLEESVGKPVCLIFRNLILMQEDNSGFSVLLDLLAELYQKQPKIGYHLLYYLKASKAANGKMLLYESFAQATALGDLHTCLMMDMKACQEDDVRLLCFLTPSIYTEFPDETLRSGELLNMIVAVIDSTQLQELMCHVMMGNLVMFRKDSVLNILIQSLDWETFEQYSTWQLFLAHSIALETIIPILQHLKYKEHPEALSCLLLQLRREKPSEEMVKMVLSRPCHPEDHFTTSLLRHWATRHDETLGEHIKAQLIKNNSQPRKRQSLRSSSSKLAQLTLEQILEHLDNLRLSLCNVKNSFFSQTPILQALQHVQASCDEAHKMRFSDLFSLAEEFEDAQNKPPKSRRKAAAASSPRQRKGAAPPTATVTTEEESASSSASEEEDSKPKAPKRKRKGSSAVGSDSD